MEKYTLWTMIRDIAGYVKPYRRKFFAGVFFRATSDLANLIPAYSFSNIVSILTTQTGEQAWNNAIQFIFLWMIAIYYFRIAHDLGKYFGRQSGYNAGLDAKFHGLRHMYKLDLNWHEKENSGNKIKRVDNAYRAINDDIKMVFEVIIEATINIIGVCVIFSMTDVRISIAMVIYVIIYFMLSHYLSKQTSKRYKPISAEEENYEGLSFESINNIRTLKMLLLYSPISVKIKSSLEKLKNLFKKYLFATRVRNHILDLFTRIFEFAAMFYLVYLITHKIEAISLLILFRSLYWKVIDGISEFAEVYNEVLINKVYISRFHVLLQEKPTIEDQPGQINFPTEWSEITLNNLSFAYAEKQVLKNLNFSIKRGEKIGIVGISGAGKSTFVKLILDMYEDYSGDILFDDKSLKQIKREDYINYVASVSQDTELFNATLEENITIGLINKNSWPYADLKIKQACDAANLNDVIDKLPDGLQTIIGEKGFKLSGGERQRVGIARAIIRDPQILILDEATSHLDSDSERKIQDSLDKIFKNVTAIVIAHRLSTLTKMDKIIVLENGEVVEEGKLQNLVKTNGRFASFWKKQNSEIMG